MHSVYWRRQEPTTIFLYVGHFDIQIRQYGKAFEHHFDLRGREFERSNLQKFKCLGFARGDVEVSNWSVQIVETNVVAKERANSGR